MNCVAGRKVMYQYYSGALIVCVLIEWAAVLGQWWPVLSALT